MLDLVSPLVLQLLLQLLLLQPLFNLQPVHSRAAPRVTPAAEPSTTAREAMPHEEVPLPLWDRYLKEVSRASLNEKNAAYKEYVNKLGKENNTREEWMEKVVEAFEKMMDPETRQLLNNIKKKEVDAIRRRLIPRKKNDARADDLPTYLDMTVLRFTKDDLRKLIESNLAHVDKFTKLREENFQKYEMEKRFHEEQRLRHIKTDEKRKQEQERYEAERAANAAKKHIKHPLTEDTAKEVWETQDELPKDEFNPKTFFALNDVDGNKLLDMDEVRRMLQNELKNVQPGDDKRETREELERMRDHIYTNIDQNKDLMIDLAEFMAGMSDNKDNDKNWDTLDKESFFNESDFEAYEKERLHDIREDIAEGKKPQGYDYTDVPLLDNNFLNETHIRHNGEWFTADDTPPAIRREAVKQFDMQRRFDEEQIVRHIEDPLKKRRAQVELEAARLAIIKVHLPLSIEQLKTVWREQDHMNDTDYTPVKFFHLHDINGNKEIDKQEMRLMLITELRDAYADANKTFSTVDFSDQLETMKEEAFTKADTNKDGVISLAEFEASVLENEKQAAEKEHNNKMMWHELHEGTEFTEEEYVKFREEKVLHIRKMIAEGVLPENYNYSDVPLLTGNFINSTHVMRDGNLVHIHKQGDHRHPQRVADFKRARMEARYRFDEAIKHLTPEQQAEQKTKAAEAAKERRRKRHEGVNLPLSEVQEREVWEKEDKMDPKKFDLESYFRLHDVDRDGKWSRQEVAASLMTDLERMVPDNSSDPTVNQRRSEELDNWLLHVMKDGDLDKDDHLNWSELNHLSELRRKQNKEKHPSKEEEEWNSIEDDDYEDYNDDEFKKFVEKEH